ncbi:MAG: DUF1592 domain-containing protein [Marinagarivorans sp.]|nr:DUF1592 domain-containing protein [Marinagarivorans sp.]
MAVNACATTSNLALGLAGTASTLDANSGDTLYTYAFDGKATTRWSSNYSDNEWLAVDLGSPATLCAFNLVWEAAYGKAYQLQVSDNGTTWRTVYTQTNGDGGTDAITLPAPVTTQYVRMLGTARATQWGYSLWSFDVLGTRNGPPIAAFSATNGAMAGEAVAFNASAAKDPGGLIVSYAWSFGDGQSTTTTNPQTTHTYGAAGTYTTALTVTDNDNNTHTLQRNLIVFANLDQGQTQYQNLCASCHGDAGQGVAGKASALDPSQWQIPALTAAIDKSMPLGQTHLCQGSCASQVAAYVMTFSPPVTNNCTGEEKPVERSLRLLTNIEYQNTINDLFNVPALTTLAKNFPGGVRVEGFDNNAKAESVNESRMNVYWEAAKTIAAAATQTNLNAIVGCNTFNAACADTFVTNFGRKVFRRDLTAAEKTAYSKLFLEGSNLASGAEKTLKGLLISPHFLYRPELGTASGNGFKLTPYETATLLAYTFTSTTPDAALLTAAANNQLQTREQLIAQVQRLLTSPKATGAMVHFARQWLHVWAFDSVTKNTAVYPGFTAAVKNGMSEELDQFSAAILLGKNTQFKDLYVADYTYANRALADYYGLNGASDSTAKIATNGTRGGILKLGAWLSTQGKADDTSPVLRGVFVRKHLLCQPMPLPAANLQINIPMADPGVPARERFSIHSQDPTCHICHQYIDNLGFGFDTFDGAGKAVDNPDDFGILTGINQLSAPDSHPFQGVHELSTILASSHNAAACVVQNYQIYATGQAEQDECTIKNTAQRWKDAGYSFAQLWSEIVSANTFLIRR